MNKVTKEEITGQIESLPTLPVIFHHIMSSLEDETSSAASLKEIIIKDQTISSKVLKLANSAYYGLAKPVDDIRKAVVILGFGTIRNIALSASMMSQFSGAKSQVLKKDDFWIHSIAVAELGKFTAKKINFDNPDQVYTAGLLHDIGKLALTTFYRVEYEQVIEYADGKNADLSDAEKEIFGFDHGIVGYWIGNSWRFPDSLLYAIENHHTLNYMEDGVSLLPHIIYFSDLLVRKLNIGFSGNHGDTEIPDDLPVRIGLSAKDFEECIEFTKTSSLKIFDFLQITIN